MAATNIVATRVINRPNVSGSVVFDVSGREVGWLKLSAYASSKSREVVWKCLTGEGDE